MLGKVFLSEMVYEMCSWLMDTLIYKNKDMAQTEDIYIVSAELAFQKSQMYHTPVKHF